MYENPFVVPIVSSELACDDVGMNCENIYYEADLSLLFVFLSLFLFFIIVKK